MATREAAVLCRTTLNYFGAPVEVTIRDGRRADLPGWEVCGFELRRHGAAVHDWDDDEELERAHHAEMAALARDLSGCDEAHVVGHIKRNRAKAAEHHDLAPITFVHSDFADSYLDVVRARHEDARAARRVVILQFWRNIGPPKMDQPLAFCDARTVPRSQIRPFPVTNYAGGGIDFDALGVAAPRHPDDHHWYAFDAMTADEVVAFRTFDTDRIASGDPYWTPHSAFRDPDVPLGRPSRSSIELRATCLYF